MPQTSDLSKKDYKEAVLPLRSELIQLQLALKESNLSVLIVIGGDDRSGRHETLNILHEWMDPRFLQANAYGIPTEEEKQKPFMWRYWKDLPPKGSIGLCLRDWTSYSLIQKLTGMINQSELDQRTELSNHFEKTLTDNGVLLIKIWLHLPEKELKLRLKEDRKYLHKVWKIHKQDSHIYDDFKAAKSTISQVIKHTNQANAPWNLIDSTHPFQRNIHVGKLISEQITAKLSDKNALRPTTEITSYSLNTSNVKPLETVDLSLTLDKQTYKKELKKWQTKVHKLIHQCQEEGQACVMVFEGWDAAGKGGAIRRLTNAIDAGFYRVVPIAAPSSEELSHHYLWRFWRKIPRPGKMTIFDRSWYGRVLVERVEELASHSEWQRSYEEINDFEMQLASEQIPVLKFWLHIDKDEQLKRFKERESIPYKRFKITEEDYRNRSKWKDYEQAVNDMINLTSTKSAPWHVIPANNKYYARIQILKTVCTTLQKQLKLRDNSDL